MGRGALLAALALVLAGAAPRADARTFVVDPNGNGDFTTIRAAVQEHNNAFPPRQDTLLVHAGAYADTVNLDDGYGSLLECTAGPDSTSILGVSDGVHWTVRGLTVNGGPVSRIRGDWTQCRFHAAVDANAIGTRFRDCEFYDGDVTLRDYTGRLDSLRFHHAKLTLNTGPGSLTLGDCAFVGSPAQTLVEAHTGDSNDGIFFEHCVFDSGAIGVVWPRTFGGLVASHCVFGHLGVAIEQVAEPNPPSWYSGVLFVSDSRFDDCDRGVVWLSASRFVGLSRDTLSGCATGAIDVGNCRSVTMDSIVVASGFGGGLHLDLSLVGLEELGAASISHSSFEGLGGTAIAVDNGGSVTLTGNRIAHCDTAIRVTAGPMALTRNVLYANAGIGLVATFTSSAGPDSIAWNTSALNAGDGVVVGAAEQLPAGLVVTRNVVAQNGGAGYRYLAPLAGTLASNDAWQNYGGGYVGLTPDETNLALDPMFCGLANGDLSVSVGSPCAPNMPTGPMGALGVGCDTELLGAPPLADATSLAVRPNPARGSVEFALPARAGAGAVEVLDVQGRRVWSTPIAAGASAVRWRGERAAGGRAGAGIYWVRAASAGAPAQTKRFIWLE